MANGMSKAVLISIRPQWCEKIASGEKAIEVRKTKLLCEMDRGHCDGVQDICMQAIEASKKLVMTEGEKDGNH